jgi:peptide deformylase
MAVLPILTVPNPLLLQKARAVRPEEFGPELKKRLTDMAETMYAAPGVGLAGPQVADLRRILTADLAPDDDDGNRGEKGQHLFLIVNPEIIAHSDETIRWEEGCLSVPELWEYFENRWQRIRLRWQDPLTGDFHEEEFEDYPSVIVQHELDHLDGVIMLDRVSRLKKKRYLKKVSKILARLREEADELYAK